jgi:hypothetical protein
MRFLQTAKQKYQSLPKTRLFLLAALAICLTGLSSSRFLMSLGIIVLAVAWVSQGSLLQRLKQAFTSPSGWGCFLIFIIYLLGMIYTDHPKAGWHDVYQKLIMVLLPVVLLGTEKITHKELVFLLRIYILAAFVSAVVGWIHFLEQDLTDKRFIAIHLSYAQFEINICFSAIVCLYLLWKEKMRLAWKIITALLLTGFVAFLGYMGAMTGIFIFAVVMGLFVLRCTRCCLNTWLKYGVRLSLVILFLLVCMIGVKVTYGYFKTDIDPQNLPTYTVNGNLYTHGLDRVENGSYINVCVCSEELSVQWNQHSIIPYDSLDKKGNPVKHTLIRYLNSKKLTKDSLGIAALTPVDVKHIENGIANIAYTHSLNFIGRYYGILWELADYYQTGNCVGYSLAQRFELWKQAWQLFLNHPVIGTGTGAKQTIQTALIAQNSPIGGRNMGTHNQYLTFLTGFGITGFILIFFGIFYAPVKTRKICHTLFWAFFVVVLLSMLVEDPLETQEGITFFSVFYSLFLFSDTDEGNY